MRILYGITTNGNGHLSRGLAVIKQLRSLGCDVDVVLSGPQFREGMNDELLQGARVFRGVRQVVHNRQLQIMATVRSNNLLQLARDVLSLPVRDYDLVVSDFEPLTAWAGQLREVRTISLCRQNIIKMIPARTLISRCKAEGWGLSRWQLLANKFVHNFNAPGHLTLGVGWHRETPGTLPPIIPPVEAFEEPGEAHLVYLPWLSLDDQLTVLGTIRNHPLLLYHAEVGEASQQGNIQLRPLNRDRFREDFRRARGIVANAGFTLASESIVAGKKLLVFPVKDLMEQQVNAWELKRYGFGEVLTQFSAGPIIDYLARPNVNAPVHNPDVARAFAAWVRRGDWSKEAAEKLSEELWR